MLYFNTIPGVRGRESVWTHIEHFCGYMTLNEKQLPRLYRWHITHMDIFYEYVTHNEKRLCHDYIDIIWYLKFFMNKFETIVTIISIKYNACRSSLRICRKIRNKQRLSTIISIKFLTNRKMYIGIARYLLQENKNIFQHLFNLQLSQKKNYIWLNHEVVDLVTKVFV